MGPEAYPFVNKDLIIDGIHIIRKGQQQTQIFTKSPPLPTKTQIRTALKTMAHIGGIEYSVEKLRKRTFELTQMNNNSAANLCRHCKSMLTHLEFNSVPINPIWVEFCTKPGCRAVYIPVFKHGIYDCTTKKWFHR